MQPAKSGVHPIIIRWHFFMIPVMLENQDLRPRLFAKTYILASPSSLPTHPYKKRLGHFLFLGFSTPYPGVCFQKYKDYRLTFQCDSQ